MKLEAILQAAEQAGASVNMRSLWPPTLKRSIDFTPEQLERFVEGIEAGWRGEVAATRVDGVNAEMLAALKRIASVNAMDYEYQKWARAAIAKVEAAMQPVIQHLPADDTEGGGV